MTLLLAKIIGVQKSSMRISASDLSIISIPMPFTSPQEIPITGLFSVDVLFKIILLMWSRKINKIIDWLNDFPQTTIYRPKIEM